jgi:glycoside/pentoside/hexuronide:cation symporter, GPH family
MPGIAYAIITLATSTLWGVISGWLLYFYLPPTGEPLVPIALYSLVMLISRGVNILLTLPIGHLSDRTHSRWGRRMPYVVSGALLLPVLFILMWTPPHAGESVVNLLYIAVIMVAFNIAYEVHQVPYEALFPELLPGEKERINISAWRTGFQLLGAILTGAAGPLIEKTGYAHTAILFALGTAPFLFLPMFFLREKIQAPRKEEELSLKASLKLTISNRSFQIFILAWALFWIASTFVMETLPYIVTEICRLSEAETIYFYIPAVLASLLCFPVVTWLSKRFGKIRIFGGSLLAGAVVLPGLLIINDRLPFPLIVQGIFWISLQSIALSGAQVLPTAIAADITDMDEKVTGRRREGSFYAFWGLLDQLSSGIGSALLPLFLLLGRSNTDPHGPIGVRLLGGIGGLLLLVGFLIFRQYPRQQP